MFSHYTISVLLLFAALPSMMIGGPQQITTSTTSTSYVTRQILYSGTYNIMSPSRTNYGCYYYDLPFTGTMNQRIMGSFSSDIDVGFYVMRDVDFQSWLQNTCDAVVTYMLLVNQAPISSFSFNFIVNMDGKYHFVLVNGNRLKPSEAHVVFNAFVAG